MWQLHPAKIQATSDNVNGCFLAGHNCRLPVLLCRVAQEIANSDKLRIDGKLGPGDFVVQHNLHTFHSRYGRKLALLPSDACLKSGVRAVAAPVRLSVLLQMRAFLPEACSIARYARG